MKLRQSTLAVLIGLSSLFFIAGCGDTFRPIATPLPRAGADPAEQHTAVVVFSSNSTPSGATGTAMQINVAGESISGQVPLGADPVYALIGSTVISVNRADSSLS